LVQRAHLWAAHAGLWILRIRKAADDILIAPFLTIS
jgi:hypothetical protein